MANYTRDQILFGIERAKQQGNEQMAAKLSQLLNQQQPSEQPTGSQFSLSQIQAGIKRAEEAGNEQMVTKLRALASQFNAPDAEDPTTVEFLTNEAKLGFAETTGMISATLAAPMQEQQARPMTIPGLLAGAVEKVYKDGWKGLQEVYSKTSSDIQKMFTEVTNADPEMKTDDFGLAVAGTAVRTIADPFSYVGLGAATKLPKTIERLSKIRQAGKVKEASELTNKLVKRGIPLAVAKRAGQAGVFGGIAETGGQIGEQFEEAWTGEEGTGTGRLVGSLLGGVAAAKGQAVRQLVKAPFNVGKQVYDKYKFVKRDPEAATTAYAAGTAKRLLEQIQKGYNKGEFESLIKGFKDLEPVINRGKTSTIDTNSSFPLLAALSKDPVAMNVVQSLVKSNPAAKKKFKDELDKLALEIDARSKQLFGARYAALSLEEPGIKLTKISHRVKDLSNRIEELETSFIPGQSKEEIGESITNLVNARLIAAKKERGEAYKQLTKEAQKNGVRLPKEAVRDVYNFVIQNKLRDVFIKGTPLDNKVQSQFGPQESLGGQFGSTAFRNVDSLKRAINRHLRKVKDPQDKLKLVELKNKLDEARRSIPGTYDQRLRDLDRLYYEKVGVPFGEEGIKDIFAKKYAQDVAPAVLKSKETVDDFLDVAGQEGIPILKNAYMSKMYYDKSLFKEGILDLKTLVKMMKSEQEIIRSIPGLREELTAVLKNQDILSLRIATLNKQAKAAEARAANEFLRLEPGVAPNYKQLVSEMESDPRKIDEFFNKVSDLSPNGAKTVRNAMKRELLHRASKSSQGMLNYLVDPANKTLVDKMFGKSYINYVKKIAKLTDAIKAVDIDRMATVVAKTEMDPLGSVMPGLDVPYVTSQIRDKIASVIQKGVRIASRVQVEAARKKSEEALMELFLDPEGMEKALNAAKIFDFGLKNPIDARRFIRQLADSAPLYFYATAKANTQEEQ